MAVSDRRWPCLTAESVAAVVLGVCWEAGWRPDVPLVVPRYPGGHLPLTGFVIPPGYVVQ